MNNQTIKDALNYGNGYFETGTFAGQELTRAAGEVQNRPLPYDYKAYTGKVLNDAEVDSYNCHVRHIAALLHFHKVEDDSLSGQELTRALDRRHKCAVYISAINEKVTS